MSELTENFELPWEDFEGVAFPVHAPGVGGGFVPLRRPGLLRRHVDLEVVIPAYNEQRRLHATLASTLSYLGEQDYSSAVVVVDNGSVDYTSEIVDTFQHAAVPVFIVGCAQPGKGAAVRRGFTTGESSWVGFIDADGSTPIDTLDRVMPLLREGAACVFASRHTDGSSFAVKQAGFRQLGGQAFRALGRTVVRGVADTQCGFKFFRGEVIRPIVSASTVSGFAFDLELLARLQQDGHQLHELPVVWADADGSTFSALRHGPRVVLDILRLSRAQRVPSP